MDEGLKILSLKRTYLDIPGIAAASQLSSDEEDDNEDSDGDQKGGSKKKWKIKINTNPGNSSNLITGLREIMDEFMKQQMQTEMQRSSSLLLPLPSPEVVQFDHHSDSYPNCRYEAQRALVYQVGAATAVVRCRLCEQLLAIEAVKFGATEDPKNGTLSQILALAA
ncbi:hypothetical protein Fot_00508 [Forsythia ovata]|uniref:Uncharacterized protein n=1 Tax=Forsythia ovata TaxID=205694 RepID=A0ABD1X1K0_9LAMI